MQPGQHITPTIRLRSLLGKGGMGSVWVADHLALGTHVAVKFMSAAFVENAALVQRFRTEAMAAAQIKSPHVAQVFDHGFMADGTPYIVMELLEGEDLKHRIRREGPLPLKDVSQVISQAAKALGRAHALGIVHRDIKPDNIFLSNIDGETFVKVLDFGIAKVGADNALGATTTGSMMGTPLYMSPEQLLSAKRVDLRSDLWSLAVVAYHAITGRVPFHGETVGSLSVAVHAGVYAPPSSLRPDVPPALDAWFQKALRRDPNERFSSAKEMADALEQAIAGVPPQLARPVMPSQYDAAAQTVGSMGMTPQPTLGGTSSTAARSSGSKMPALVAVGLALAAVAAGVIVFVARDKSSEGASPPAAAQESPPPVVASPAPPPVATPAQVPVVAPEQPVASATPSATQAAAAPKPTTPATVKAPPAPSPATTKKTVKTNDSIGF